MIINALISQLISNKFYPLLSNIREPSLDIAQLDQHNVLIHLRPHRHQSLASTHRHCVYAANIQTAVGHQISSFVQIYSSVVVQQDKVGSNLKYLHNESTLEGILVCLFGGSRLPAQLNTLPHPFQLMHILDVAVDLGSGGDHVK